MHGKNSFNNLIRNTLYIGLLVLVDIIVLFLLFPVCALPEDACFATLLFRVSGRATIQKAGQCLVAVADLAVLFIL